MCWLCIWLLYWRPYESQLGTLNDFVFWMLKHGNLFAQLIVRKVSPFYSMWANFPHQFFFFVFAWQYKCLGSCIVCSLACVTSHSPASKPVGTVQVGGWSLSGESVSSVLIGCNVLAARQSYFTSKWLFGGEVSDSVLEEQLLCAEFVVKLLRSESLRLLGLNP